MEVCGKGAFCTNTEGSFTCTCPEGTIPDPDPFVECVSAVKCTSEKDCAGNAICGQNKRCYCPEPNVGDDCRRKRPYL